ncbi:MAG: response regulator transcription factor [Actinobacteria bacterium]|nr:response regulator transcription factor [Actinomycetota bacterium]
MPRLLLVEDDEAIARPLTRALGREDFTVVHVDCGTDAIRTFDDGEFDLVLLDLTLPDIDGLDVCRAIRERNIEIPIVMLTARSDELDLVVGFDAGADDYLGKPFSMAELTARLRARLRLAKAVDHTMVAGALSVDPASRRCILDGEELHLTPKEYEILVMLMHEAGRVVSRQRIVLDLWSGDSDAASRSLDVHMSSLRKKLGETTEATRFIHTVRGVGFRFEAIGD